MLYLIKSNLKYTFQNKFYLIIQILMLLYVAVISIIYTQKYIWDANIVDLPNIPITLFLFITTFFLTGTPFIAPKQYDTSSYSIFTLSFPISRKQYVTSHYLKLLIYMLIILANIFLFCLITILIIGAPIIVDYFLLLFFIILYTVGVTGSLYLMIFFVTKFFKPIMYILYFISFYLSSIINVNHIFCSHYINIYICTGILLVPLSYLISLIMVNKRDFN